MHKTTIKVTVLSEEPLGEDSLGYLQYECYQGAFVLRSSNIESSEKLSNEAMRKELLASGSEEDFFEMSDWLGDDQ